MQKKTEVNVECRQNRGKCKMQTKQVNIECRQNRGKCRMQTKQREM
jgi:hypothetical protein